MNKMSALFPTDQHLPYSLPLLSGLKQGDALHHCFMFFSRMCHQEIPNDELELNCPNELYVLTRSM
jgi:hypothetical protein